MHEVLKTFKQAIHQYFLDNYKLWIEFNFDPFNLEFILSLRREIIYSIDIDTIYVKPFPFILLGIEKRLIEKRYNKES